MIRRFAIAAAILSLAGAARADAVEPRKPLDLEKFMGRWYEILRTPNFNEHNCFAVFQDWAAAPDGRFFIKQHCHKGSPTGADRQFDTAARVLNAPDNTKFEASFFAGLIKGRYWVVDHADNYDWMIATTADGKFPALLSRTPGLSDAAQAKLKARMAELGFATDRLQAVGAD
jgi:apolipoprotein D and lipocalin family protein